MSFRALHNLQAGLAQHAADLSLRHRRVLESAQGARVKVDGVEYLSFCSNDYLGFANHADLVAAAGDAVTRMGVGAGASHLLTGHHAAHQAFESAFAAFVSMPAALSFSTGYMANLAVISALVGRDGEIFADHLNHASLNDAALLSRAKFSRYAHQDLQALERRLAASTRQEKMIVVDGVFSMDGDLADVPALLALSERYDAWLLVDDAHGFGVLGATGRGILEHFTLRSPRLIYMATLGKAAGVSGAVVSGEQAVIDHLVQSARTYIYTTAAPPMLSAVLQVSLRLLDEAGPQRIHLRDLMTQLRHGLICNGWRVMQSETPIQPVIIGSNTDTLTTSARLAQHGILVPAIRPPTVPQGTGRLRISLSAQHSSQDVAQLLACLGTCA